MELVILLDDEGNPCGTADKQTVHSASTPLHLAFSCYLLNDQGQILLTRRSLSKRTWPGTWTNSFCGHPAPGEPVEEAIVRRADFELGTRVRDVQVMLPDFRYRAVDASGVVEHEVCPVYVAFVDAPLAPRADEVAEWEWIEVETLLESARLTPFLYSPWLIEQLPGIEAELRRVAVERTSEQRTGATQWT